MASKLKNEITSSFKMHGLSLRSEASRYLLEVISSCPVSERSGIIENLIEAIQKQPLNSSIIDKSLCERAVLDCNSQEEDSSSSSDILNVIDAFSIPKFTYSIDRKKYVLSTNLSEERPVLFGNADSKAKLYRERYTLLHQRTSRHELFSPAAVGNVKSAHGKKFQLQPIEFLMGNTSKLGDIIVLGMMTQMKEGIWFIEDNTGAVKLDLSRANFHTGLFSENCFVLAEGTYEDQVMQVNAFGFPPPEPASITRSYFGSTNFFGGPSETSVKSSSKLKRIEEENEDAMFVIISDLWLDDMKVMDKLRKLFTGYSEFSPTMFIFCGNFLSMSYGSKHIKKLKERFQALGSLIAEFPTLVESSKFLFVPGPSDPCPAKILPRPPISSEICSELSQKVPSAIFSSNPARIQYCTKEIVVFREDVVMKMARNCVRFPTEGEIPAHFAKTIICQSHLCQLPHQVQPIYWMYDHAFRLYPLPDLVICADKYDAFTQTQCDVTIVNPGSFGLNDFSFKVFYPSSGTIEDSHIAD